jgi:hypothetical protein
MMPFAVTQVEQTVVFVFQVHSLTIKVIGRMVFDFVVVEKIES